MREAVKSEGKGGGNWGDVVKPRLMGEASEEGARVKRRGEGRPSGGGNGRAGGADRSGVGSGKAVGEEFCVSHVGGGSRMFH